MFTKVNIPTYVHLCIDSSSIEVILCHDYGEEFFAEKTTIKDLIEIFLEERIINGSIPISEIDDIKKLRKNLEECVDYLNKEIKEKISYDDDF